jgi:hypothetical protein
MKVYPRPVSALEIERNPMAKQLFVRIEESGNLSGWGIAELAVATPEISGGDPLEVLHYSLAELTDPEAFFRLAVSLTPFP